MPFLESVGLKLGLSVLQPVQKEVASLLKKEILLIWKVDDKFKELQASYLHIAEMLADLDRRIIKDTILEPWAHELDSYCYDIEDIVDDLVLCLSTNAREDKKPEKRPIRSYLFNHGIGTIPHQIGSLQSKLKHMGTLIEGVLSTRAVISLQHQNNGKRNPLLDKTSLVLGASRQRTMLDVVSELTSQHSKSCGVSIIGMDGLGKTSLVRAILDDEGMKDCFTLVLCACVSGPLQVTDVVQKLVEYHLRRTARHPEPTESYQYDEEMLPGLLGNKKCLFVLDDLWGLTYNDWDIFRSNYLSLCSHWKILTTSRNPAVAGLTESKEVVLDRWTDEDCEKLIIYKANLPENDSRSLSGVEVIAKKCKGIPILANELGLKLKFLKKSIGVKKSIVQLKSDNLWEMQEFKEVFPSLKLNEPLLSPELKRCFAYCSLFPPDHEFKKEHLLKLWEVEGFIQPLQARSSKQRIEERFEDLLSRSILRKSCENKKKEVYTMHEINHEYAHLLGSKAFCRLGKDTYNLLPNCINIRHLSLDCQNTDEELLKKIEVCKGLRTFLLLDSPKPKKRVISYNFFQNLQRLRLLDLSHTNIKHLPKPTFPSKHLRYLDLSYSLVTNLSDSLVSLRSLKTLKLKGCSGLIKLPKDLNQLTSLTHLHVDMKELGCPPYNLGKLINLEVLDSFFAGKDEGCRVVELRSMEHLKKIHIFGLENIQDLKEAQDAMLSEKSLLRELTLEWDPTTITGTTNASDILNGLRPHNHLDDLILRNFHGQTFPEWLMSGQCSLVSIYLENCPNCQLLPYLGVLPHLENLVLRTFHSVTSLDKKFCGNSEIAFPCLELLEIRDMKSLVSWNGLGAGDMPLLRALKIVKCPMLVHLPSFEHVSCLMNLEINMCEELMSLPELPSSLNAIGGELVITHSALLTKSCELGGADRQKLKDITYVYIDGNRIPTKSHGHSHNQKDNANHASSSGMNGDQNIGRQRQYSGSSVDDYAHQDVDNANHASSSGMNGDQNIGRRKQNSDSSIDVCKRESDVGNQKVNEDSSTSRVNHQIQDQGETNQSTATTSTTQMPSNGNDKQVQNQGETNQSSATNSTTQMPSNGSGTQVRDQGETNQSTATTSTTQMHSNGNGTRVHDQGETNQNTATTNTTQMPRNRHGTQGHPRSSKARSSSGLFGYLFGCLSKKHGEAPPSHSTLPKYV